MTSEASDPTLRGLGHLTVLEPDPARSERVRRRCHAIVAGRQPQAERSRASKRSAGVVLESGLIYGLSVGYLFAMIGDLLRVYLRQ